MGAGGIKCRQIDIVKRKWRSEGHRLSEGSQAGQEETRTWRKKSDARHTWTER